MNPIGKLLYAYRKERKLTQKEFAESLSEYAEEFRALNGVTLSRWETGVTEPSMRKKKKMLRYIFSDSSFDCKSCRDIAIDNYGRLYNSLHKVFSDSYQYIIGNLPEQNIDEYNFHVIKHSGIYSDFVEHVIDIERASNAKGYYSVAKERLEGWCRHPSSFALVCERKKQHLGHFLMFKLKNSAVEDIVRHKRSEMSLEEQDFCMPYEKGSYYVHALYGCNPKIAAMLNVEAYIYLFKNMDYIDDLMIFSSRTDGVLLTRDYGIEEIASGYDEEFGFKWHGMLSPVEDILFSDTVIRLVF